MPVMKNNNTSQLLFALVLYISFITVPVLADKSVASWNKLALEYCGACHQFTGPNQTGSCEPLLTGVK